MKSFFAILSLVVALGATQARAESSTNNHADEMENVNKDHPCWKLVEACEKAGFKKGQAKEHKGLYVDCLKPLVEGQTVAGVTAAPEDVTQCKEKRAKQVEKKAKKEAKKAASSTSAR